MQPDSISVTEMQRKQHPGLVWMQTPAHSHIHCIALSVQEL